MKRIKDQGKRRQELEDLGGVVTNVRRSGDVFTARVKLDRSEDVRNAATKLRGLGWGVSVDGLTIRALVVVA